MTINWANLGGGLLNAGVNLYRANQGTALADDNLAAVQGADAKRRAAYSAYGNQIAGLAPSVEAGYALKPATATTGFATSNIDPATGKVGYTLDPRAQGLFSGYLTGAQKSLDLAGDFNPETMAAKRLAAQQALLAPQRAKEEVDLLRKLQAKGIMGTATAAGPGTAENPFMAALQGARSQADAKAAYDSLREGESYLDNLLKRSGGLFSQAGAVDEQGRKALTTAGDWTERFTRNERDKTAAIAELLKGAYGAQRSAGYDQGAEERMIAAQAEANKAGALRNSGLASGASGLFSSFLQSGGLTDLLKGAGNLFSGSSSWFSPSISDYATYADEWSGFYG